MKIFIRITIIVIIAVGVLTGIYYMLKTYAHNYDEYVRSQPYKYLYDNFRDTSDRYAVIYIYDTTLKTQLLKYYKELESGIEPTFSSGLDYNAIGNVKAYILDSTADGQLKYIYVYENHKRKIWVYTGTLHDNP
jgi:hypothetical protein